MDTGQTRFIKHTKTYRLSIIDFINLLINNKPTLSITRENLTYYLCVTHTIVFDLFMQIVRPTFRGKIRLGLC